MANYYCEYCGVPSNSVNWLVHNLCGKHPNGTNAGNHSLYEGSEKSEYFCKYCGVPANSINCLTQNRCDKNPNGGFHMPAR